MELGEGGAEAMSGRGGEERWKRRNGGKREDSRRERKFFVRKAGEEGEGKKEKRTERL